MDDISISPFTWMRRPGNAHGSWSHTPEFAKAQRERKKVEALFAELKNQIGLRRLRLRRLKFVREQFFLAAAAQNLKRLVRFLSQPTTPTSGSYLLALVRSKNSAAADNRGQMDIPITNFFNTHRRLHSKPRSARGQ